MNKQFKTKKGICQSIVQYCYRNEKEWLSRRKDQQDLVGYALFDCDKWNSVVHPERKPTGQKEKIPMCEKCYQGLKEVQWKRNRENGWIHVRWFYFYDRERQELEDRAQLDDYYSCQEERSENE